ncbi:MAG TPA: CoA pyrophosphatase [Methylomirabilota bacterium]|jgi:8-oxo-dGTP pyrophosphatase MutT (NUDIX family)|nr:CoA pyrophosphatase [Methylomirabilota bacterium]
MVNAESQPRPPLDFESLRARLQAALDSRSRRVVEADDRAPAAVLLLFVYHDDEPYLVFAKKTQAVPHHKGQFSFPGGMVETFDASRIETALREAQEEIGLDPGGVEVLGLLDDVPTATTRFVITPVIGLCRIAPALCADGREIERVLEIPLRVLLDPACFREELWERGGTVQPIAIFAYGDDVVWGATARILRQFLDLVLAEPA